MENLLSQTLAIVMLLLTIFPTIESLCSEAMATALSSSGFTLFAHALQAYSLATNSAAATTAVGGLTYLAPPDNTLMNHPLDAATVSCHVSKAGAFPYESLLSIPHNATLTTLHNNTNLIVGTDGESVSFNEVLVVLPDLYIDGSCAVHGVDKPLVPIPSSSSSSSGYDQNLANSRMEKKLSPVSTGRRARATLKKYMRFIRRSNIPIKEIEETSSP